MKFAIIIPVYNVERYLSACVESVISQTYKDFEIILVDDGSTDSSGFQCDKWAEKDNRLRVIHKPNGGLSDARNYGIRAAKGEYFMFLDSDDYWSSYDVLEKIVDRLAKIRADVLITNYCKDVGGTISGPYFSLRKSMPEDAGVSFIIENELWRASAWNKVVNSTLFEEKELFFVKGINAEDMDWCARLAARVSLFDYLDVILLNYRFRSSSISHTTSIEGVFQLCKNLYRVKDIVEQADSSKKPLLEAYLGYLVGVFLLNISGVSTKTERNHLIEKAKPLIPYLEKSKSSKILLINKLQKIFGVKFTLKILRFKK